MIVKFHPRGRGGGSGPVDYLLGKDRQRDGATVLQGKPEEVRDLIDASPYAKKYTSGVLSFAESDLASGQREKLMESFERVLMPGLDKDQYSVLWVEHADKGRVELNFLIPNTELLSGKRLQPYYDRADRPRIDAWQTVVNGRLGLHDPNDPANRRELVTASALPKAQQEAVRAITQGLMALASSGEIKTRQDVTEALTAGGFEVVRTTRSSISIANPDGGRNIRLKGAIYEQSFNAGAGLREEIESAAEAYRRDAADRIQRARTVCKSGIELKREENQRRYPRSREGYDRGHAIESTERAENGRKDMAHHQSGIRAPGRDEREHSVVAGAADGHQLQDAFRPENRLGETERENMGRELSGESGRAQVLGDPGGDKTGSHPLQRNELDPTETGVTEHDGAGKTVAERIRDVTAGLLEKAGRVGQSLRGMAEHVWSYATGERGTERARHELEQASAEFERAAAPVIHEIENIGQRREQASQQLERALEPEKQRTLDLGDREYGD